MCAKFLGIVASAMIVAGIAPALADTTSPNFDTLLSQGYEIKAANPLSAAATKEIWPDQTLPPQMIVSLQKGNSIAVCNMAVVSWMYHSRDLCLDRPLRHALTALNSSSADNRSWRSAHRCSALAPSYRAQSPAR